MDKQTELLKQVRLALQKNDFVTAIACLEQVVALARERGDVGAEGRHLGNLALTYYRLGNANQALENFQLALDCARKDQDRMTENGILGNMGNVLREVRRYDDAIKYLNEALIIAQELGDSRGRGIWLSNLGLVYDDLRQPDEAIPLHESSVKVARQLHDEPALAARLGNLGNTFVTRRDFLAAALYFKQAIEIYEKLGRKSDVALRVGIVGNLYAELGRFYLDKQEKKAYEHFHEALDAYGKAMNLMRELGDTTSEAEVVRSIGHVLADAGQLEDAAQYLDVAQQMFETLGLKKQAKQSRTTLKRIIEFLEEGGQ